MGVYNAASYWRKIVTKASSVLLKGSGKIRVFVGKSRPSNDWDAGAILRGDSTLQVWDVAAQGGNIFIKGKGQVQMLTDPAAEETPSDV